jgi:hypothetical protein
MKLRKLEHLENRLKQSQTGRDIYEVFRAHAEEILELINHRRQVTVVWHRNHGPEFIGQVVKSGFEEDFEVPQEIQGVTLIQLLRRMASILLDHGSSPLKEMIGQYYQLVMGWAQRFTNLSQILDAIANMDRPRPEDN